MTVSSNSGIPSELEAHLDVMIRDKDSFSFALEINRNWGCLNEVLDWCKNELQQDWRWQMVELSSSNRPGRYIFYFDSERDYFAFTLKWR